MMNSSADMFTDNPFRSGGGGNDDIFYDETPLPQQPPQQPPMSFQQTQPTMSFQPQQQQPPMMMPSSDPFAPQPVLSSFPPPSGPMRTMGAPPLSVPQTQPGPPSNQSWWGSCMSYMTLDSYKAYFDIDAEDIVTRIKAVMLDFYKPEHFRNNVLGTQKTDSLKGPDLYGPFWLTMTLIFFIGVTSNMHDYLHRTDIEEFDYDINHLLHAASVLSTYAFGVPMVLWLTTQCMSMQALKLVEWICIYGYSLVPYVPAVMLCIIPFGIVSWVFLIMATVVSCSLVVRNVAAPMLASDVGHAKAPPVLLAILGTHIIFFLFLKFSFYHHTSGKK